MKWFMLIPIFLPVLISKSYCDTNNTESHIFVRNSHAEANIEPGTTPATPQQLATTTEPTTVLTTQLLSEPEDIQDDIVFLPNDKPEIRIDDYSDSNHLKIGDVLMMKTVGDVMDKNIRLETESPSEDIVFISGKNSDHIIEEPIEERKKTEDTARRSGKEIIKTKNVIKLNCIDSDCNNTIKSICGGKIEHNTWKYRLFLNECYFRKVNCNFKYEINRYKEVGIEKCARNYQNIAFSFKPKLMSMEKIETDHNARKTSSSRRSLTMGVNGQFCSHPCPVSCRDDYDPECAVSATGQRRVFVNHCKLDFNSCSYGVVWHRRPLADCVGGKKADMRQNRGFIGWMRRVGIVDKTGRLTLQQ